jgi:hypothetical protein
MNFRRRNYNCAFYYCNNGKIYKINKSNILQKWVIYQLYCQTRRHWYADFSLKCQRNVNDVNLENIFFCLLAVVIKRKFKGQKID